jgi:DNA repair protein RadA/Sms
MGFHRCLAPAGNLKRISAPEGIKLVGVESVERAMEALF